jgi:hypothetical protein
MPATAEKTDDADFDRYSDAAQTFTALRKQYLDALGRQPGGAVQVALIRLKAVRDSAEVSFASEQRGDAAETDWSAEARTMEAACEKLRSRIDALPATGASEKSPDDGAKAKELAGKADAFRKRLKALESDAEAAADQLTQAEAAVQDVADRGRDLKVEIEREIEVAEGHDVRAR